MRFPTLRRPSWQRVLRIVAHVTAWLVAVCLPLVFLPLPAGERPLLFIAQRIAGPVALLAGLFYLNYGVFIPRLLAQRHFGRYFAAILVAGAVFGLPLLLERAGVLPPLGRSAAAPRNPLLVGELVMGLVWLLSSALRITSDWFASEQLRRQMRSNQLATELAFLKSQVNPHFLFNTLNNVYSLAELKSDDAPMAILKLSQLMRYMLYEADAPRVPLTREVEYLHNYLDLQRLRLDPGRVPITFEVTGALAGHLIEPMLLIPFVENAFKHGISFQHPSRIALDLRVTATALLFTVRNQQVEAPPPSGTPPPGGVGLANVGQRLHLLYPGRHTLVLDQSADEFVVTLTLQFSHAALPVS